VVRLLQRKPFMVRSLRWLLDMWDLEVGEVFEGTLRERAARGGHHLYNGGR
jgi:hypothetical protein